MTDIPVAPLRLPRTGANGAPPVNGAPGGALSLSVSLAVEFAMHLIAVLTGGVVAFVFGAWVLS